MGAGGKEGSPFAKGLPSFPRKVSSVLLLKCRTAAQNRPGIVQELFRLAGGVKHDTALRVLSGQFQKSFTDPGMEGQRFRFKATFVIRLA